ncbi:hypothetical protein FQN55_004072 [Onygenales sp. PD_40]|nr:hypothetical protein FQN55_004072 [Onygenales sp. PD_40]
MAEYLRDTAVGQILRWVTGNKVLLYPEEEPNFQVPTSYANPLDSAYVSQSTLEAITNTRDTPGNDDSTEAGSIRQALDGETISPTPVSGAGQNGPSGRSLASAELTRTNSLQQLDKIETKKDVEKTISAAAQNVDLEKRESRIIVPQKTDDGTILVDWYSDDDPANPQNWGSKRKIFVASLICAYTLAVYMGSSIYTSSIPEVQEVFGVSITAATLGLAVYVLGYGTGPMLFSPLSEVPVIGRNPPYIITFALFVILSVPTALVDNFGGLLVLRFLQGFFGSPCLATGGASFQDIYPLLKLPYALTAWIASASIGPSLGPVISGFSVPAKGWRWSLWEILWLSGPIFILLFLLLPETSSDTILLRRAARLRKLTGNKHLKSQSEIKQAQMSASDIAVATIWRPFQIMLLDPAVFFTNVYSSLVYGIYYSFFEVFPIVYMGIYGFNFGQMGLVFLAIIVGNLLAVAAYCYYLHKTFAREILSVGLKYPERRLIPALFASAITPVGLFLFGWTARGNVHWIVSTIGIVIYSGAVFVTLQCIFLYIPLIYPQYAASLFAGNDIFRSALAAGAVLFARPLFLNLGIGQGVSLLAGLTVGCAGGTFALFYYGAYLRSKSKFAVS